MKRVRVVLADDHVMLTDAIRNILEPQYEVVGTFADGEALVNAAPGLAPDVVILDIAMPRMSGLVASSRLKKLFPKVKIVFLTMNEDLDTVAEAFKSGASAVVLKTSAASELLTAVREVLYGRYFATPSLTEGMVGSFVHNFKQMNRRPHLTERQKEVLHLLAEGYSMREIADILQITTRTVAFHKYAMMEQLGIQSSAGLVSYATRLQLGSKPDAQAVAPCESAAFPLGYRESEPFSQN